MLARVALSLCIAKCVYVFLCGKGCKYSTTVDSKEWCCAFINPNLHLSKSREILQVPVSSWATGLFHQSVSRDQLGLNGTKHSLETLLYWWPFQKQSFPKCKFLKAAQQVILKLLRYLLPELTGGEVWIWLNTHFGMFVLYLLSWNELC